MLSQMAEDERIEYERQKREGVERKRIEVEERRKRDEEQARIAMEQARIQALILAKYVACFLQQGFWFQIFKYWIQPLYFFVETSGFSTKKSFVSCL